MRQRRHPAQNMSTVTRDLPGLHKGTFLRNTSRLTSYRLTSHGAHVTMRGCLRAASLRTESSPKSTRTVPSPTRPPYLCLNMIAIRHKPRVGDSLLTASTSSISKVAITCEALLTEQHQRYSRWNTGIAQHLQTPPASSAADKGQQASSQWLFGLIGPPSATMASDRPMAMAYPSPSLIQGPASSPCCPHSKQSEHSVRQTRRSLKDSCRPHARKPRRNVVEAPMWERAHACSLGTLASCSRTRSAVRHHHMILRMPGK